MWVIPAVDFLEKAEVDEDTSWCSSHTCRTMNIYRQTLFVDHIVDDITCLEKFIAQILFIEIVNRKMHSCNTPFFISFLHLRPIHSSVTNIDVSLHVKYPGYASFLKFITIAFKLRILSQEYFGVAYFVEVH